MKTKKWYSALLAFALLATGCSNEIDPDNNGGGSGSGEETAYVTINVMASSNAQSTKATGGETGDGYDSGTEEEQVIKDLNIYYIPITGSLPTSDTQSWFNYALADDKDVNTEYITDDDFDNVHGSGVSGHLAKATVKFKVPKAGTQSYLILALANFGEKNEYAKLSDIKEAFLNGLYTDGGTPTKFLMTTHQLELNALSSIVTFTEENKNPNTPASATVFLERLAARVDLQLSAALSSADGDYLYKADGTKLTTGDKVKMNGFLVVNQLQPSTRFLKLLSGDVASNDDPILTVPTGTYFFYPEEYGSKYLYVLDPWTKNKNNPSALPSGLTYENQFVQSINDKGFTTIAEGTYATATRIAYVRENTMDLSKQLNGFSTGIIFRGKYIPEKVRKYDESDAQVKEVAFTGSTFFRTQSNLLCEDMRTIAALAFTSSHVTPSAEMIKAVFNAGGDFGSITVDAVKAVAAGMTGGAFGLDFKNYLNSCTDLTDMTWAKYVASASREVIAAINDGSMVETDDLEKLISDYKISCFERGYCYYKYWIRHADNNDPHKMGLMEFAIVRNNLYQVEVKGVNKMGDPLPFVPGQDDPTNPDESEEESYITVNVYVKNWVVRKNNNIIL